MSLKPVARLRNAGLRWRRYESYRFTARTALAPLAGAEIGKAALALPLAFTNTDGSWGLAALLSVLPEQNLYVAPDGRWLGSYVPAAFRAYPFCVGWNEAGEAALCVDEASGLLTKGAEGEAFFDEAGNLSPSVAQVWQFLQETLRSETALAKVCGLLHASGVIEPWVITVETANGKRDVPGVYRINEAALGTLDDAAFGTLRRAGAIGVAYAQLLSMSNIENLGKLAQARAQMKPAERAQAAEVKPMIALPTDSTIDWDWSKIGR